MVQNNADHIDCPKRILDGCVCARKWCDRRYCSPQNKKDKQYETTDNRSKMNEISIISSSNFLGKEIDVYGSIEEPLFLAKDVAERIGYPESSMMLECVDEDEKLNKTILTSGQKCEMWFLTESGLYEVLMQSRKPIAKQFKHSVKESVKSVRKTGSYTFDSFGDRVKAFVVLMKNVKELSSLSNSQKLSFIKMITEQLGLSFSSYTTTRGILKSEKELLKKHNCGLSPIAFNKLAIKEGLLEVSGRVFSNGIEKEVKSITKMGLTYGENKINPANPYETQPLWYEDKFGDVIKLLGL